MQCIECGTEFTPKRATAKFCSNRCRVTHGRSVTLKSDSVTLSEPRVTLTFKFYTETAKRKTGAGVVPGERSPIRTAQYWYDVPVGAIPVIQKGWPKMPDYMNGRQYFLWWKNDFKMNDKFPDSPEIMNPGNL